jgi:hypothetical protein
VGTGFTTLKAAAHAKALAAAFAARAAVFASAFAARLAALYATEQDLERLRIHGLVLQELDDFGTKLLLRSDQILPKANPFANRVAIKRHIHPRKVTVDGSTSMANSRFGFSVEVFLINWRLIRALHE